MSKNNYYAYFIESENNSGITESWKVCESVIKGRNARYKGFKTLQEAKAWLTSGAKYTYNSDSAKEIKTTENKKLEKGIYFDAGTGRGIGVEVRVTDEKGNNLLHHVAPKEYINAYGNYLAPKGSTNNYGELFGCYAALKIALDNNIKSVFGDSKLVIDYWSKGHIKSHLPPSTIKLAAMVKELRIQFEQIGGKITHVSGDINPADLGFHK